MAKKSDRVSRESSLAAGWTVEADSGDNHPGVVGDDFTGSPGEEHSGPGASAATANTHTEAPGQLSNGFMLLLGILGGLYLAYTWIWFSWSQYMASVSAAQLGLTSGSLGATLQLILYGIVPLAPLLWFIAVLVAYRGRRGPGVGIWLAVGAIVLAPLPYLLAGTGALSGVTIGLFPLWSAI